jgi:hypothetical protein
VLNKQDFPSPAVFQPISPQILCRTEPQVHENFWCLPGPKLTAGVGLELHQVRAAEYSVLAAFVLITAAPARNAVFSIFGLAGSPENRRQTPGLGHSMAWQHQTAELAIDHLALTLATYYVLTVTLFASPVPATRDLRKIGHRRFAAGFQWSPPLLVGRLQFHIKTFANFVGICGQKAVVTLIYLLAKILIQTRPVAIWYSASIGYSAVQLRGYWRRPAKGPIGSITPVTAVYRACFAALAIAEHMCQEHEQRLHFKRNELEHARDAMPIGLFIVRFAGQFFERKPGPEMLGPWF